MDDGFSKILGLFLILPIFALMPIVFNLLSANLVSNKENQSEIIVEQDYELVEGNKETISYVVVDETGTNEEISLDSPKTSSDFASLVGSFSSIIRICCSMGVVTVVFTIIFNLIKYATYRGYDCSYYSFSSSNLYSDEDEDTFKTFLNKLKTEQLTLKNICKIVLKSNKTIIKEDAEFLDNCVETKTEWYSFKHQIREVDENEKAFAILLLDVLANIDSIKNYFDNTNKCLDYETQHDSTFYHYISNKNNYFEINGKFYLKEIVFYVLTNNKIQVRELYNYLNSENEREDLGCAIANFIELELSYAYKFSTTETLEEAVAVFNADYNLKLTVDFAKNLVYLSKLDLNKDLHEKVINETTLLNEMKEFKYYKYK